MSTNRRVFLVEAVRANIDITPAEEFGEICYIFNQNTKRKSVFKTNDFCADVLERLQVANFNSSLDLFCVSGSMVPVCVSLAAIVAEYAEGINVLFYNSIEDCYIERKVVASNWASGYEEEINVES